MINCINHQINRNLSKIRWIIRSAKSGYRRDMRMARQMSATPEIMSDVLYESFYFKPHFKRRLHTSESNLLISHF